jgi:hypothetical protein
MKRAEMQTAEQNPKQAKPRRGNPNWVPGRSQNPKGRETKAQRHARRERIIEEWCKPHGGLAALRPAELMLLHEAAELMLVRVRNSVEQLRRAGMISAILQQLGFVAKRDRRGQPDPPSRFDHMRPLGRGLWQPREQRSFMMVVKNHMRKDEEISRFCAENGVTEHDQLIVTTLVPFETRPGETAKEAYERELRTMARKEPGRESQEALPHRREGRTGIAREITATASTPPRRSPRAGQ